jgi:UDP-N-acetylmuramoylalanine--D-glutamate ligase
MHSFTGKQVTVVGMGLSGVAAARLLRSEGARVAMTDDKTERDLEATLQELDGLEVDYHLGGIDSELLLCSDFVVISPGVPSDLSPIEPGRKAGVEIISEIELAYSFCEAPIIAITGTNGKTTTTGLVHHMADRAGLKTAMAGNIEIPFSGIVREDDFDLVALEVSSFQLENIRDFCPMVGVVLNISPDHLDRYHSIEDYAAAKVDIFRNQSETDFAVLNHDDPAVAVMAKKVKSEVLWFSSTEEVRHGTFLRGSSLVARFKGIETEVMKVEDIPLVGWHNVENTLAAVAATLPIELPIECYREAVAGFPAPEHRMEKVKELDGVLFVNDSKATNVGALERSLESFTMPIILIAGGRGKKGSYQTLRPMVKAKVKAMLTIGEDAVALEEAFGDLVPTHRADSLTEAVKQAVSMAKRGDCVLLSPACASFDMFSSYAHRGKVFKEAVESL